MVGVRPLRSGPKTPTAERSQRLAGGQAPRRPPVRKDGESRHPGGMPEPARHRGFAPHLATGTRRRLFLWHASGVRNPWRAAVSGGAAALDHRLISGNPPGSLRGDVKRSTTRHQLSPERRNNPADKTKEIPGHVRMSRVSRPAESHATYGWDLRSAAFGCNQTSLVPSVPRPCPPCYEMHAGLTHFDCLQSSGASSSPSAFLAEGLLPPPPGATTARTRICERSACLKPSSPPRLRRIPAPAWQ
jgi:hypothetical protein